MGRGRGDEGFGVGFWVCFWMVFGLVLIFGCLLVGFWLFCVGLVVSLSCRFLFPKAKGCSFFLGLAMFSWFNRKVLFAGLVGSAWFKGFKHNINANSIIGLQRFSFDN